MPRPSPSLWTFVGIGIAGGLFSALFGVGGGGIVVPLLVLLAGFDPRPAAGTSLAAIGLTAIFGVASFSALGEVNWGYAAMVGLPAVFGTLAGTWVQQRISSRLLVALFALFLAVIAVRLLLQ